MTKNKALMANKWASNHITQNLLIFKSITNNKHTIAIANTNTKNTNKIIFLLVTHTGIIKINKIMAVIGQIIAWIEVFIILLIIESFDLG